MSIRPEGNTTIVTLDEKLAHAKEPDEAWIFRLFGAASSVGDTIRFDLPEVMMRNITHNRTPYQDAPPVIVHTDRLGAVRMSWWAATALASVHNITRGLPSPGWDMEATRKDDGIGVVIVNDSLTHALLTTKDDKHPNPRCRDRYSLLSGSLDPGESPYLGMCRELYEEVSYLPLADVVARYLRNPITYTLPSVQWSGDYRLTTYTTILPDQVFDLVKDLWTARDVLAEAKPCALDRESLMALILSEHTSPGACFVASHHIPLEAALNKLR